jgi:nitrite reductase (NADH) large subunit
MRYLIIGNGVAGTTAAETIRKSDGEGDIIILTEEETPFYSRIRLIEYLAGEATEEDIIIHNREWHEKNRISLSLGSRIKTIDADTCTAVTDKGKGIQYDRLLLATGGISFIPPITGSDKKGVFALRTITDADEIISYAEGKKKVVLIGGGVLGLEAGNSLRKRGCEISVVEFFPRLLPRQMDVKGADILRAQMESMGFSFYLGARTKEITGEHHADGVLLEDGIRLDAEMIIISAGVRPRAELAQHLGLSMKKGVPVNDRMETEREHIYAAGDLIEHRDTFYGIWPAARQQGEIAGINMAGGNAVYEGTTMSNVLKVVGIDLAAAGDIDADNMHESIVIREEDQFRYRKLVINEGILSGCILYGDTSGYNSIMKAIEKKKDVRDIKEQLQQWDLSSLK